MQKMIHELELFEEAVIVEIAHPDPAMQRRLLDLGFSEGSKVTKILISPGGDPSAYKVRGATIALRQIDARHVLANREDHHG